MISNEKEEIKGRRRNGWTRGEMGEWDVWSDMDTEDLLKGLVLKWKGLQGNDEGEADVLGKDEGKGVGG